MLQRAQASPGNATPNYFIRVCLNLFFVIISGGAKAGPWQNLGHGYQLEIASLNQH